LDLAGTFKLGSSAALLEVTSRADPPGVSGHESLAVPAVTVGTPAVALAGYAEPDQARPARRGVPLASHGVRRISPGGGMRPAGASPIMMQKGACADSESPLRVSLSLTEGRLLLK
jgi:hypothetical protein